MKYLDLLQAEKYKTSVSTRTGKTFWYKVTNDSFKRDEYKNLHFWIGNENAETLDLTGTGFFGHQLSSIMMGFKYKEENPIDIISKHV